jgi:hypothetical protein
MFKPIKRILVVAMAVIIIFFNESFVLVVNLENDKNNPHNSHKRIFFRTIKNFRYYIRSFQYRVVLTNNVLKL